MQINSRVDFLLNVLCFKSHSEDISFSLAFFIAISICAGRNSMIDFRESEEIVRYANRRLSKY